MSDEVGYRECSNCAHFTLYVECDCLDVLGKPVTPDYVCEHHRYEEENPDED